MSKLFRKSAVVFIGAVLLSMLLEWLYRAYFISGDAPGPDVPPTKWYIYTSDLVTYLVKGLPAVFAGYGLKHSGFLIGATVGICSEVIQIGMYVWQYPPPITWNVIGITISNLCLYAVIGCIAGAAGELLASRHSNNSLGDSPSTPGA